MSAQVTGPSLRVTGVNEVALSTSPVGEVGPGHVLVEVAWSGVSLGTELAMARGGFQPWGPMPFTPGYQGVGTVVRVGEAPRSPDDVAIGDTVAFFAGGAHRRHVVVSREFLHRIPSLRREAALFVQAATASNALGCAGVLPGRTVLVVGQGLIGQMAAVQARLMGANVIAADRVAARLAFSRDQGVDEVIDVSKGSLAELVTERWPDGVDVVLESTGSMAVIDDAVRCARRDGVVALVGVYAERVTFDLGFAQTRQLTLVLPWFIGDRDNQAAAVNALVRGDLGMPGLITHVVPWDESEDFYRRLLTPERETFGGVVIDWRDAV